MSCKFCQGTIIETSQFNTCSKCGTVEGPIFVNQQHKEIDACGNKTYYFMQYTEKPSRAFGCGTTFNPHFSAKFNELSHVATFYTPSKSRTVFNLTKFSGVFDTIVPKHVQIDAITLFKKAYIGRITSMKVLYLACLKVITRSRNVVFNLKDACDIASRSLQRPIREQRVNKTIQSSMILSKMNRGDRNEAYTNLIYSKLDIPKNVIPLAKAITKKFLNKVKMRGFNPLYLTSAAVYASINVCIALHAMDRHVTMNEICDINNITCLNIRDIWMDTFKPIYKKIVIKIHEDPIQAKQLLLS